MAKIYKEDGTQKEVEPQNGKYFTLRELQEIVGGLIEMVYLKNKRVMVVNEEGKILGLDLNVEATEIVSTEIGMFDIIVGTALVCETSQIK